jgi:hypothetical protein
LPDIEHRHAQCVERPPRSLSCKLEQDQRRDRERHDRE